MTGDLLDVVGEGKGREGRKEEKKLNKYCNLFLFVHFTKLNTQYLLFNVITKFDFPLLILIKLKYVQFMYKINLLKMICDKRVLHIVDKNL